MRSDLREDLKEAWQWLTVNIRTTEDAEKLAEMLGRIFHCFDTGTGCRALAVQHTIQHFHGSGQWTPTIRAAEDILRQRYGRLWNYTGD